MMRRSPVFSFSPSGLVFPPAPGVPPPWPLHRRPDDRRARPAGAGWEARQPSPGIALGGGGHYACTLPSVCLGSRALWKTTRLSFFFAEGAPPASRPGSHAIRASALLSLGLRFGAVLSGLAHPHLGCRSAVWVGL